MKKIYLGTDHAGFELKEKLKVYLQEVFLDYEVMDLGAFNFIEGDDYPDYIKKVAEEVSKDNENGEKVGIILGGSGQGEAICANRFPNVLACVFYGQKEPIKEIDIKGESSVDSFEIIKLARRHNNANILSIGARFVGEDEAKFAVEVFLKTEFLNEERHLRRINKVDLKN